MKCLSAVVLFLSVLAGCEPANRMVPPPQIDPSKATSCNIFLASCPLSQMLLMPSLVWSVRCDEGKTVIAKHRIKKDSSAIIFWTMLPPVAEPVLERDTALANFQSTQYGFALGLDVKKVTLLTFDEFFERLERDAPNAMLFLDRSTHEKSGCATLRFNQPGSKTT